MRAALDQAQAIGHALGLYLHPLLNPRWGAPGSADPADPAVRAHAMATLDGWMAAVGEHPGLAHLLLNSEYAARWQRQTAQLTAEMAKAAKARRPGLLTWTDPWRDAPVRLPPGVDALGSWSYGHPHPLRLWITPFLHAGAGAGRKVMQTASLFVPARWSASGEEAGAWRILPPDPAALSLWLAFAQAPDILAVYAPSTADPFAQPPQDPLTFSPSTWPALKAVHSAAIAPFGPVLRQCRPVRAGIALVLSAPALAAVPAAARPPGWEAELAWPVAAMLVMQGFPFEVKLDEDFSAPGALAADQAAVVPFAAGLPDALRRALAGRRVIAPSFDLGFLRLVDGGLANRLGAEEAASRLARLAEGLARELPPAARMARHDPDLAVGHHAGGAVTWHVAVNLALAGAAGATFRDRGVARRAGLGLRAAPGTMFFDARARRALPARFADGFAELALDLPAAGGAIIAALPGEPGPPRLEPAPGGALLRAPFAGVMAYDLATGGVTRRVATGADGTHAIAARGPIRATCALTGASAALDI